MMLDGPNRREYLWRFPLGSAALQCYRQVIERFLLAARHTRSGVCTGCSMPRSMWSAGAL